MKKSLFFISILVLIFSCTEPTETDPELSHFAKLFEGIFSSEKQSEKDAGYSNILLVNSPIWQHQKDSYWFYHELCDGNNPNLIYYQRIINIHRVDSSTIGSTSYVLSDKKKYKNGWKNPSIFDSLSRDSLQVRLGCDLIYKKKTSTIYQGKTKSESCLSTFSKNIAYTTSNVVISQHKITSWDRGFDAEGRQVWGKIQGPYRYDRDPKKK